MLGMGSIEVHDDLVESTALSGGQSLVFHCHFYNCALQQTIEQQLGDAAAEVQRSAAERCVRAQLAALSVGVDAAARLELGASTFAQLGFGTLDLSKVSERGGQAVVSASHYGMGWVAIYGERKTPACNFVEGFVAAVVGEAFGLAADRVRVRERQCFACGAERCTFDVEVL